MEKDKIALNKIFAGYADANFRLLSRITGQCYIENPVNFLDERGTIYAFQAGAAESVWRADETGGHFDE